MLGAWNIEARKRLLQLYLYRNAEDYDYVVFVFDCLYFEVQYTQ